MNENEYSARGWKDFEAITTTSSESEDLIMGRSLERLARAIRNVASILGVE